MQISIIIPTYNRSEILFECLKRLEVQTFPKENFEVIVVDDGSEEDIKAVVEKFKKINILYLKQSKEGQAKALNLGIKEAHGEIVVFLDNDMMVVPEFVEEHFRSHIGKDKTVVRGAYTNTTDFKRPKEGATCKQFYSRAFFITGNVSIRKSDVLEIGLFDEDFTQYGWLDLELGKRLRKRGFSAFTNSKAFSYHYQKPIELADLPALAEKEIQRGRMGVVYYRKHPSLRVKLCVMNPFIMAIGNLLRKVNWLESKLLKTLSQKLPQRLFQRFVEFILLAYYVKGIKENLCNYRGVVKDKDFK